MISVADDAADVASRERGLVRVRAAEDQTLVRAVAQILTAVPDTVRLPAMPPMPRASPETGSVPVTAPEADRPVVVPFPSMTPATPPMPSASAAVSAARTLASSPSTLSLSREPRL